MPIPRIILESDVTKDIDLLTREWASNLTFLFISDKSGIDLNWSNFAANLIPTHLQTNHFGILTSGSTGEPKLIIGNKKRSQTLVHKLNELQYCEKVAETICALPLSYSYAFINQWLWSHVYNRPLRLTPGFNKPDSIILALQECNNAMLCLVGSQVSLIHRFFPNSIFPGVIRLHFAGGRFPQEELEFLMQRFPNAKIFNNYGCAEAMPRLTLRAAEDADEASHIGYTLPGVEMKSGKDNHLLFRSPYRAVAYIDDAGFHSMEPDDWVPTGDLGEQTEDGGWKLLGRANEVFKRFGEKISLPRVLTTIKKCWTGDAAFFRTVDPGGEQAYILILSPEPSKEQLREVLMGFRKNHTRPHWPLRIESINQFPMLANGKTDLLGLENVPDKTVHWRQRI